MTDALPPLLPAQHLVDLARSHTLSDLLHRTAARAPDKRAIIDGETRLSYAELDIAVTRTANALLSRGLATGDRLALFANNSWQYAVLAYATARIGVILVPVNFNLTAHELAYILEHSGSTALIADADLVPIAEMACSAATVAVTLRASITMPTATTAPGWEDATAWTIGGSSDETSMRIDDDTPVRLMYTSGTEARPKGVVLSSRSLIAEYVSCIVEGGMTSEDIELHCMPLYHCAQMDCFLGPDIYLGATSIILARPDPETVLSTLAREQVTKFFAPPTVWISLLRSPAFDTTDLSSLRKGYYGASAMPRQVLREIQDRLPGVRLWNFYGQTELSPLVAVLPPADQTTFAGAAGRPVLNVQTLIVDDGDRPLPAGQVGEIVHRSPQATSGYWNDQDKTRDAFRNGWFHSGDLGTMSPEGRLTVVDRKKDMIKTGGENVASREVEEAIYLNPDVAEVAVFSIPHPKWVEAVCAAVVLKPGSTTTSEMIIERCASQLAGFKRPKYVSIVESLPKNPSGKILKRDLRTAYLDLR